MNYETKRRLIAAGLAAFTTLTGAAAGYGGGKMAVATRDCPVCPECPKKVEAEIVKPLKVEIYDLRKK